MLLSLSSSVQFRKRMGATVITLVVVMVISGIIESVLMLAGKPYWFDIYSRR